MLIDRHLRLTSPLLAGKPVREGDVMKRVFVRVDPPAGVVDDSSKVYIAAPMERWAWAFLEARDSLELDDVATGAIIPSVSFSTKRTSTYNRKYRRGSTPCVEKFESISSKQRITMTFTLSKHVPPGMSGGGRFSRAPDVEEFDAMLSHIGEHLGMSEWGQHYLYGRFKISNEDYSDEKKDKDV